MSTKLTIKFKKSHADAILPTRKHGNRNITPAETALVEIENQRLEQQNPEAFNAGYRVSFPSEINPDGTLSDRLIGTGDTGYDIYSVEDKVIPAGGSDIVNTGIDLAYISPGFWFKIEARSGLGFKHGIQPHPGIVDNSYQGNCGVKLYNFSNEDYNVSKGDRIAQIVFYPVLEADVVWTEEVHETERGSQGFGSSGK